MSEDLTKTIPQNNNEKLDLILTSVLSMTVRVDSIDFRLQKVVEDVALLHEGQQRLEGRQQRLEESQHRLEESQHRLEESQHRLEEGQQCLAGGLQRLELGQEVMRSEFETLKRSINHRFLMLSGQVQASYNNLEERVTRLESNTYPPNSQT